MVMIWDSRGWCGAEDSARVEDGVGEMDGIMIIERFLFTMALSI